MTDCCYAEYHYAKSRYEECRELGLCDECRNAGCRYAECSGALYFACLRKPENAKDI